MKKIKQAMILAAGLGTRMGELTKDIPKPMIEVNGISLIERHLHYLLKNDIHKVVINTYYKADIFEAFVKSLSIASKMNILFSREGELLGTAGGVKKALSLLGEEPFFVVNSDSLFIDDSSSKTSFKQLEEEWDPSKMLLMLLLAQKDKAFGHWGKGDFDMDLGNKLNLNKESGQYLFPGLSLMDYRAFIDYPEDIIQFVPTIYKDLMSKDKVYGSIYQGQWLHIGDMKAYEIYTKRSSS
jgi:N-acetyl-alpha-D-muramate 1-phosphate uridylyltransferase